MVKKNRKIFLLCIAFAAVLMGFGIYFYMKSVSKQEVVMYSENSTAEYFVCLSQNDYYKETCLGEEKEYLRVLTNEVRVTFNYNRTYSKDTDVNFKYRIGSRLAIYNKENNREIYADEKYITDVKDYKGEKQINNIQDIAVIRFADYSDVVNKYVMDYSINSKADVEVYLLLQEGENETKVG